MVIRFWKDIALCEISTFIFFDYFGKNILNVNKGNFYINHLNIQFYQFKKNNIPY